MRCKKINTGRESSHLKDFFFFFFANKWKKHFHSCVYGSKLVTCPSYISSFTPRQRDKFQHCDDVGLMSLLRYMAIQHLSDVCFQLIAHSCPVGICTCSFIGSANQDKSPTPGAAIDSPRASRCLSEKPMSLL